MAAMTIKEVVTALDSALAALAQTQDVLRDLDAAVGDGDLGITVDKGSQAIRAALSAQPPATIGDLLRTSGAAFAKANPSTMAALVGAGLLAASKDMMEEHSWTLKVAELVGRAAMDRIAQRGKAVIGDKTVLDALSPSLDALGDASEGEALVAMIAAATTGRDATTNQAGRRGRAAWVGDRGNGHPDPGATAYILFLIALKNSIQQQSNR